MNLCTCCTFASQRLVETKPLPVLVFRCLILAVQAFPTITMNGSVTTLLHAVAVHASPWADAGHLRGFLSVVKLLLPKSIRILLLVKMATTSWHDDAGCCTAVLISRMPLLRCFAALFFVHALCCRPHGACVSLCVYVCMCVCIHVCIKHLRVHGCVCS
jgi:hypothetical protein